MRSVKPIWRSRTAGYGTVDCEKTACSVQDIFDGQWMSHIEDEALLSSLTIPGTHDSATYTFTVPFIATQNLSIIEQLDSGVRYLDLRCGLRDDIVEMVHGPTILGQTLDQVFATLYLWLNAHPTEALIVQIKQDRVSERSTVQFASAISSHISARSEYWRTANTTPTLGELRGKIQLFRRFRDPNLISYGIDVTDWKDNPSRPFTINTRHEVQLTIQDHYSFTDPTSLPDLISIKGGNISGLLYRASDDAESGHWYLNFTSASEFSFLYQLSPKEIAVGGYWFFKWIDGLNPRLATFVRIQPGKQRYGIVIMDFPEQGSADLVHLLIMSNFEAEEPSTLRQRLILCIIILLTLVFSLILGYGLASIQSTASIERSIDTQNLLMAQDLGS